MISSLVGMTRTSTPTEIDVPATEIEMNGADVLIFTAGIAENNPILREKICANLDFCGLELDHEANNRTRADEAVISTSRSKIEVRVIPTNEEIIIARNAWAKLSTLN